MSNRFPSMTALLGLLAVAGYQNRDKLGQWLSGLQGNTAGATPGGQQSGQQGGLGGIQQGGLGGILGNLAQSLGGSGGATTGGFLNGGLSELVELGSLKRALRVGVSSGDETPSELEAEADVMVDGTDGVRDLLRELTR